jgi:hypothetical protein
LAARSGLGRYLSLPDPISPTKKPVNKGLEEAIANDRAWCIIAGPQLTKEQLRVATVPDGANGRWEGGEYQRIEVRNEARLRKHFAEQAAMCLIQPHHPPVNVVGGYRFPGAPAIDLRPTTLVASGAHGVVSRDGLDIPEFLRRPAQMPAKPQGQTPSYPNSKTLSSGERPADCQESIRVSQEPRRRPRAPALPNGVAESNKDAA